MNSIFELLSDVASTLDLARRNPYTSSEEVEMLSRFQKQLVDSGVENLSRLDSNRLRLEFITIVESSQTMRQMYLASIYVRLIKDSEELLEKRDKYTVDERKMIERVIAESKATLSELMNTQDNAGEREV